MNEGGTGSSSKLQSNLVKLRTSSEVRGRANDFSDNWTEQIIQFRVAPAISRLDLDYVLFLIFYDIYAFHMQLD